MDKYKFGNKLTEYRTEKGLTQSELGEILGVSNKAVSKWENGSAMPRLDMMSKITDYFGVSMDEFLDIPSDRKATDVELEQKYLKLYNEKMRRRKVNQICYFVIIPILLVFSALYYIFGPVVTVRMKYNSLPEYVKQKAVEFDNYNTVYSDEEFENTSAVKMNERVIAIIPDVFVKKETGRDNNYEQIYSDSLYNAIYPEKSDVFDFYYSSDETLEHADYFLNKDGWFAENYDGKTYRMYDLKWLYYNYDWTNIKCCDWKKAKMSYNIMALHSYEPVCDKIMNYNGENAKGFIMLCITDSNGEKRSAPIYRAELYNDNGDKITIQFIDKENSNSYNYETFCKVINSVEFISEDALDEESEDDVIARRKEELPYVLPDPDKKILTADEMEIYSLNENMTEEDIVNLLGQPKEIKDEDVENIWGKKNYIYDGVSITFLKTLYGEPLYDEIYSAVFTDNVTDFPRGIKIGDSMESVISKFPQERDKDYRITGEIYGDGNNKLTEGFANISDCYKNGERQDGEYEIYISCGYWPTLYLRFDKDLNVCLIAAVYRGNGISTGFIE